MGNHNRMNCRNTPQYCNEDGKPKTTEQLFAMRRRRPEPQSSEVLKPWEFKLNVNNEYHIGGALDGPMPDYYGETENSANVPYFPGGNQNPNTCQGAGGAACAISLFVSLIPYQYGPPNTNPNFFVSFQVNYNDASGVTMSDIYWANHYQGPAVFRQIKIGKQVKLVDDVYMSTDGQYRPISESGGWFDGSAPVWIEIAIDTLITGPNGSGTFNQNLPAVIPSLQQIKDYMQR